MIATKIKYMLTVILEIVYLINYQPNDVPTSNRNEIEFYMQVALVAGLFTEMKSNEFSKDEKRSMPFHSFILDKSKKAVFDNKKRFTSEIQQCFPKMNLPKRGADGKTWYIS